MLSDVRWPAAEVEIDESLVRSLLADQHPDLAMLDLVPLEHGWDNALWRLGEELVVRLPRREIAAPILINEQHWLPLLAPQLPLPVPAPVRTGQPSDSYPWSWSIVPWLPGLPGDPRRFSVTMTPGAASGDSCGHFTLPVRPMRRPTPTGVCRSKHGRMPSRNGSRRSPG